MSVEEEIKRLEEEISKTPYNKATEKHIGILKAKLAKLKARQSGHGRKSGPGYAVKKTGDATVVLVGFPSVGKSTLLNKITNAESKVGDYDFTTLNVIPGMMEYNQAKIQVLDVPGVIEGVSQGKGQGKQILSVVRSADLIVVVIDVRKPEQLDIIEGELYRAGFRLNQKPPDVKIQKRSYGGIEIGSAVRLTKTSTDTLKSILQEFKIHNAEVTIRSDITVEEFIDCLMKNRVYVPEIVAVNKIDLVDDSVLKEISKRFSGKKHVFISAENGINLERLKDMIWNELGLIRVYLKKIGKEPDMDEPLIMKAGSTVKDVCERIHKELAKDLRYARIWGESSAFPGQKKGPDHVLLDKDIVELHF